MDEGRDAGEDAQQEPGAETVEDAPAPTGPKPGKGQRGQSRGTRVHFTGRAAQLAVMAELLQRQCNAAVPEVDLGTDVFVFKDGREEVVRLQVKSCTSPTDHQDQSGYSAEFALPMKQLRNEADLPPLYYALAVLRGGRWCDFLVVSRFRLQSYLNGKDRFGSHDRGNEELKITVKFRADVVTCSGRDLTDYRNAWESLPPLQPPPGVPDLEVTVGPGQADAPPATGAEPS